MIQAECGFYFITYKNSSTVYDSVHENASDWFSAPVLCQLTRELHFNKTLAFDNVTADRIIYAHPVSTIYISHFFNMCMVHGTKPSQCFDTLITPILKIITVI